MFSLPSMRPYQYEAHEKNEFLFRDKGHQSVLNVMATGLGKTRLAIYNMMSSLDLENERVLICAQNNTLVYQFYQNILQLFPELEDMKIGPRHYRAVGLEMAKHIDSDARILVATRQTLAAQDYARLRSVLEFGAITRWVIDEADQSITKEWQEIHDILLEANPRMITQGFTATTERGDGLSLGIRFEVLGANYDIRWGINNGWLKPIVGHRVDAVLPDLETASPMQVDNWMHKHYEVWQAAGGAERHTIHFLPNLETARQYCRFLQIHAIPAVHIDSQICIDLSGRTHLDHGITYSAHRARVFQELQQEAIYVTNKDVLSRGFDWRKCNMIFNSAATQGNATFTQRLGRGTRLPAGVGRMLYDPRAEQYLVDWENGSSQTFPVGQLPFFPETLFYDFSASDAQIETVASLFGDMAFPEPKEIVEREEVEEETEEIKVVPIKPTAQTVTLRRRLLYQDVPLHWYQDVEKDVSATLGSRVPWLIYISAPRVTAARQIYAALQKAEAQVSDDPKSVQKLRILTTVYDLMSEWVIWIAESVEYRGYSQWETITPSSLLFTDTPDRYPTLEAATPAIVSVTNQLSEFLRNTKDMEIDFKALQRAAKTTNPPTQAQLNKLDSLVKSGLPRAGWADPFIVPPKTIWEASQAISHHMVKASLLKYMSKIASGEVWLNYSSHKRY